MKRVFKDIIYSRAVTKTYSGVLGRGGDGTGMKPLFVFSHMRSGSSLLSHILFSHPAIHGFGESFVRYRSPADLYRLPMKILLQSHRLPGRSTYVLDKILHSHLVKWDGLFGLEDARYLFLLREPVATMQSLLRAPTLKGWHQMKSFNKDNQDPTYIGGYLADRIRDLAIWAERVNDRSKMLFLTHEQVLGRTDEVFRSLQSLLGVEQPFSENYGLLRTTGKPGAGDPSGEIKSGRINRDVRTERETIEVDEKLIEGIRHVYNETVKQLEVACMHLTPVSLEK